MVKPSFLKMCINSGLKAKLQQEADRENRSLSNFIETSLSKIGVDGKYDTQGSFPARQDRRARLTMPMNAELKAKLQELADADYRNLADFVEAALHESVVRHLEKPKRSARDARRLQQPTLLARKTARLSMRINVDLRAQLQQLADEQGLPMTDFVTTEFWRIVSVPRRKLNRPMLHRQKRDSHVGLRISTELKANLQALADAQYRTLTDFIEIEMRRLLLDLDEANRRAPSRRS